MDTRKKRWMLATKMAELLTIVLLVRLLENAGTAYFATVLELYVLLETLFLTWVPDYTEKMVRSRMAKEQYKNADKVFKTSFFYGIIVGIFGSLVLLFTADAVLKGIFAIPGAAYAMKLLAPAFLFQAVSAVLQGYFQGTGTAMPTVAGEFLQGVISLAMAFLFGTILYRYGIRAAALLHEESFAYMYAAAGAALGYLFAAVLKMLFLLLLYLSAGRRLKKRKTEGLRLSENGGSIFKQLFMTMLSAAGMGLLFCLKIPAGLLLYQKSALDSIARTADFGAFYGGYLMLSGSVAVLSLMIAAGVENGVVQAVKREEVKNVRKYLTGGIQSIFFLTAFFAAAGLSLGGCYVPALFGDGFEAATVSMQHGFLLPVFLTLGIYFAHILTDISKTRTVFLNLGVSFLGFVLTTVMVGKLTKGSILMLVYGLLVFSVVYCLLNGFFLLHASRLSIDAVRVFLLPFWQLQSRDFACSFYARQFFPC